MRIFFGKLLCKQRQKIWRQGWNDSYFQFTAYYPLSCMQHFIHGIPFHQYFFCMLNDGKPRFCRNNRLLAAIKNFKPHFLLQFMNLHTQCRLRYITIGGSECKMPESVKGRYIFQLN